MELLLISEKKMKIMLSKEDMDAYGLDVKNLDYNSASTRDSLDKIFEIAKIKTGFQTRSGRMFVQAYPDLSGGCEIFLTVIEGEVAGLVGEGRSGYICSCFKDEFDCRRAVEYMGNSRGVNKIKAYKDIYTDLFYLIAKITDDLGDEGRGYLRACFFEVGALRCEFVSKNDFSRERYEMIDV